MPDDDAPLLYDLRGAARQLGVSAATMRRYLKSGRLPYVKLRPELQSGRIRVERAALEKFVADHGKDEEFKGIAGQISAFLAKPRKAKPCPPA